MEVIYLQYLIIGIVVYLGLFMGKLLTKIAPEELRPGKKYLIIFQKILFIIILTIFIVAIKNLIVKILVFLILIYFIIGIKYRKLHNNNFYLIYTLMGLFLGMTQISYILYAGFPCFLIGLPTISLNHKKKLDVYIKLFIVFFIALIVGFFLQKII